MSLFSFLHTSIYRQKLPFNSISCYPSLMASKDIFNFEDRDLVNLQGWYRKQPRQFTKAARNVLNAVAGSTRQHSIQNITSKTTTRSRTFVSNSIRTDNAGLGFPLASLVSSTYSVDLSRAGRSDGFESLEAGRVAKGHRVPTMFSRGPGKGRESAKVARPVRMDKRGGMLKRSMFRGKNAKTKRQQTAAMLSHIRKTKDKTPFEISKSGLGNSPMRRMEPGIWRRKTAKNVGLMNPFHGVRGRSKRLRWMARAVDVVTSRRALGFLWSKEINKILKAR